MQQVLSSDWFTKSVIFTAVAVLFTFVPIAPVGVVGGLALLTILPGAQIARWLGLYQQRWNFATVVLSLALGMVTSPILIYWSSLIFGYSRALVLIIFPLYIIGLAAYVASSKPAAPSPTEPKDSSRGLWLAAALLISVTALGVFLAYFELNTPNGFYPVQMEDWQKHYGVAFALRHTGIPPTSMFFYGMFPDDTLVYYYFLHLNGATLDLLQQGGPFLHQSFVTVIVLASLTFSSVFLLLAQTLFRSQKAAVWSLAFATVIGGLDVIPIVHRTIQKYRENFPDGPLPAGLFLPHEHVDNWVSALSLRFNTFFTHHIWVPQHLTGLTILGLGLYLYLRVQNRRKLLVLMPVLLFALLGHSTWIAAIVAVCLFLFALLQIFSTYRQQGFAAARTIFLAYAVIALLFAVIAAPFILSLVGPNAPKSGIVFEIPRLDSWPVLRPFQARFGPAIWARLLDLPLHFFIEMGPLLLAGLAGLIFYQLTMSNYQLTMNKPTNDEISSPTSHIPPSFTSHIPNLPTSPSPHLPTSLLPFYTLLLITGTLTVSFFASGRGWEALGLVLNNDLGLRALMPGQLVLALFAGYFMARLPGLAGTRWRKLTLTGGMSVLIALGAAYAGWEFTAMGLSKYWVDPQLEPDVYQTLRALPEVTVPQDKPLPVVQHRLHRNASRFQLSLGGRPVGFSTGEAVVFHQNVDALALALDLSKQAFDNRLPVRSYQMFHNLGANYIFVGPAGREPVRHPEAYRHSQYFQPVYLHSNYQIYQVQPLPYGQSQPQAQFDNGDIVFEGYFIDATPQYPGEPSPAANSRGLVTAWRLAQPVGKNYTLFIHFVDAQGNVIAQADHQLWAWDVKSEGPTTTWTPKLTHLDIIPLPEAALTASAPLTIRIGLWLPESGQQFPPQSQSLQIDAGRRLIIGSLTN